MDYIDNLIYGSTLTGESIKYQLKDRVLRNMVGAIQAKTEEEANTFFQEAKQGFFSERSYSSAADALKAALPRWHICTE